jgi:hypothetical protein
MGKLEQQILDGRYIVEAKLVELLAELFPGEDYEWEVGSSYPLLPE